MGKVKGQFDFCRMTRGHLSFAELMSCQCGVKGGRGGCCTDESPAPPGRGPARRSCTQPGGPGEHGLGGALDGPGRGLALGLASKEGRPFSLRKPMQSGTAPWSFNWEPFLGGFLPKSLLPHGTLCFSPSEISRIWEMPRCVLWPPTLASLSDTVRCPRKELWGPLALTEGLPSQLVSCPWVRATSCHRGWTPQAQCSCPGLTIPHLPSILVPDAGACQPLWAWF